MNDLHRRSSHLRSTPRSSALAAALTCALAGCGDDASATSEGATTTSGGSSEGTTGATDTSTSTSDASSSASSGESETTGAADHVLVQLVAFNDFHGNIEPPSSTITLEDDTKVDAGGAAYLAAHVAALRAENPNTIVVAAGDLIGASPLTSALFHDEPTIEVMNMIGLDYNAVGNHEFDEGWAELLRMQEGGCHPVDGCLDGTPFDGAAFQYLSANVLTGEGRGMTLFPSYAVREVAGVKLAFIGMTLEGTPGLVTPSGVDGLSFVDEAERANALVPELQAMGVETIVVLIHEGGYQTGYYNQCEGISGAIVDIVDALDPAIDVVVSGHTHQAYKCVINDKIVTSAASYGRLVTDIDLTISVATGDVVEAVATNRIITREVADPTIEAFVAGYTDLAAPLAHTEIGTITETLTRDAPVDGPGISPLGLVIADAQLAATADPRLGGAQIAFMNPGGVRADFVFEKGPGEDVDGIVTFGEAFTVQPFGNTLAVMTLSGAQIRELLEQQWTADNTRVLQVSAGFAYTWSLGAPIGQKVVPESVTLDGAPIVDDQTYRVTVNSFLASGGDGFTVLVDGADPVGGTLDMDALVDYFAAASPVSPPALDRVTVVP
ncbi:MAG: bifunctional metallophosphatase/5'-nucleotidase [Nannocystaceae bacterium]